MAYKFKTGQKLIIELISADIIEGEFISSTSTRIDLINCVNRESNENQPGIQHFYQSEIVDVKSFEAPEAETDSDDVIEDSNSTTQANIITIPEDKYNQLKKLAKKHIYMATKDARFNDAVNYLANCETIAVTILGTDFGRTAPIDLLVIASWDQIYLFDMFLYNCKKLPDPIKYLLESDDIVKVVHDSRGLVDCLFHRYNCNVNNIFDTYIASEIVSGKNLEVHQCLSQYFNFPEGLMKVAMDPTLKTQWDKRPLEDDIKEFAAMNVQYLITLKNYLQKQLLRDFNKQVAKHAKSTLESSPLEAQLAISRLNIS